MKYLFVGSLFVFALLSCTEASKDGEQTKSSVSKESSQTISVSEKAINQKVHDAYALISFDKGSKPDFNAFDNIFTPYATLLNFRYDTIDRFSIGDFKISFSEMVNSGQIESFHEVELSGETEYFGKIGHRISTYATYINTKDSISERGVNSFQLINLDGDWRINSIIWDVEKPGQKIPD